MIIHEDETNRLQYSLDEVFSYALLERLFRVITKLELCSNAQKPQQPAVTKKYKDGSFTGSARGYNQSANITVSVTISNDRIKSVSVEIGRAHV